MKIPETKHWAIFKHVTTYIPGDERSRTHPGHGYPEHTVESLDYEHFSDHDALERRVKQLVERKERFTVAEVQPLKVETRTTVILSQ